jgi:alpha-N-acetylglucosaminidase
MDRRQFLRVAATTAISNQAYAWASIGKPVRNSALESGDAKPGSILVVYNSQSSAETIAAHELQKYIGLLTGTEPGLMKDQLPENPLPNTVQFLVGRTPAMARLISSGAIADPHQKNPEAYAVRTLNGSRPTVAFLGGTDIATLYSVYDYLETYCHIGFFQDGEHVPHRDRVPIENLNLTAAPRFDERMAMNLTLYWYSVAWWELADWQKYIDWALKNRFNILSLWDTPGEDLVWRKVWKARGIEISDQSYSGPPFGIFAPTKYQVSPPQSAAWMKEQSDLNQQLIRYARARGMRTLSPAVPGIVPPEYLHIKGEANTFKLSWRAAGMPTQHYLHPSSSAYLDAGKAFLEEYNSLNGSDHLYWLENYLECVFTEPPEVVKQVCGSIARRNFQIVDQIDPQGVGFLSAWTFLINPGIWTPALIQEHLSGIPVDRVRVIDQWAEMVPVHQKTDYFYGRPWHLGVVYSFAYDTNLHGDMALIQKQFRSVCNDPRAERCVGFYPNWETIGHNYFYYEFLCRLGWNPSEVELKSFTHEYAMQRYGDAAPIMVGVLEELLASVYGSDDLMPPAYWYRLGAPPVLMDAQPYVRLNIADRSLFIPHLQRALEQALKAEGALSENSCYRRDLNDIARQYLAEQFNDHVRKLEIALGTLDADSLAREGAVLEKTMNAIEKLLGCDDYYWLTPIIQKAQRLPGAPADIDQRVRKILISFGNGVSDYAVRDYYEMVREYYRPRVRVYIQALGDRLERGQRQIFPSDELDQQYSVIENAWLKRGPQLALEPPVRSRIFDTAREVLGMSL